LSTIPKGKDSSGDTASGSKVATTDWTAKGFASPQKGEGHELLENGVKVYHRVPSIRIASHLRLAPE